MALTRQMLATKNIPDSIQERMQKNPGNQRAAVANGQSQAANSNDRAVSGIQDAAKIVFKWRRWEKFPGARPQQKPPSTVIEAFREHAAELTQLIRKKQIDVLFTNGDHDQDQSMVGFQFQVIPDRRKMSQGRYDNIVAVMDWIAARLTSVGEDATRISDTIVSAKRPIGIAVNVQSSHLEKTL